MKMILNNVKNRLLEAAVTEQNTLVKTYSAGSYTEEKVAEMREAFGENKLSRHQNDSVLKRIFEAFVNPFTVILIVLALVSFITDVVMAAPGEKDPVFVMIVGIMVLISGSLRFFQEQKSDRAAERLGEMVETTAAVDRSPAGKAEIPLDEIVVGDIIYLAAGDMVPADVRILNARDLFISQSSLTGESEAVEKYGNPVKNTQGDPLSCNNLAFMGTNVVSGSAKALVLAVGDDTIFGSLASQLSPKRQDTSFDNGVNSVSWVLIRFMLVMVPLVFLANGLTKGDWPEAFLFAISVAVGLTPEMLPMIVSANLAKSAVAMSKKKVIVKNLSAIPNVGEMDVLCNDK
ncbi:MAG: HAD-IC family P-type ATPase, partial [Eubacterium callanderi]